MKELQQNLITHLKKHLILTAIILMTLVLLTPLATQAKTVSKEHKTAATTIQLKKKSKKNSKKKSKQNSKKKSKHSRKNSTTIRKKSKKKSKKRSKKRSKQKSKKRSKHSNTFQTHKTIRIQSNIYQNELNKRFKDKELRTIVKLVTNGQIGYVGKFKDVKRIKDEINSKSGTTFVVWRQVKPGQDENYYKPFLQAKYKTVTDDEITYNATYNNKFVHYKTSDLIYCLRLYDKEGNLAKQRMNYWALAKQATRKAKVKNSDSDREAVRKIAYWICKHTKYAYGQYDNAEAGTLFSKGRGVCRDYSDAFWAMCKVSGIQCEYYAGTVTGGGRHGWNRVKIEGKWYWIDVTWMDCGKSINKNYYLKRKLWKNHKITELGQKNALIANVHYVELR